MEELDFFEKFTPNAILNNFAILKNVENKNCIYNTLLHLAYEEIFSIRR